MAAQIIENEPDNQEVDALPTDDNAMSTEDLTQTLSEGDQPSNVADSAIPDGDEDEIPDKYRGKSIKDIVAMHQEAEKLIGKQGSEVGELRQVFDEYIQNQLNNQNYAAPIEEEEEPDFFDDPKGAVSKAIETHPDIVSARQALIDQQRKTSVQMLKDKHTDMEQVLGNPKFVEWARATPKRRELFQQADQDYDFDAADELITNFKAMNAHVEQTLSSEKEAQQAAVRKASTGSASGSNTGGSKKVYRRADIIKLMKEDPARYEALSDEIMLAYREKRVR